MSCCCVIFFVLMLIALFIVLFVISDFRISKGIKIITIDLNKTNATKRLPEPLTSYIEPYDADFCLNGGRCFNFTLGDDFTIFCECAEGFLDSRCERKYLNRSYNERNYEQADGDISAPNKYDSDNSTIEKQIDSFVTEINMEAKAEAKAIIKVSCLAHSLVSIVLVQYLLI